MRWPDWTGVGERRFKKSPDEEVQPPKTAWDFLQLLIVPAILVVIALAFNASQASRDRSREDRRTAEDRTLAEVAREDATLDAYLSKMSNLILERGLGSAKQGSAVREVARAATLTTLRRLDGPRKGEVVRFLYEARLLRLRRGLGVAISLEGADLSGVDLAGVRFGAPKFPVLLTGSDLHGARFDDSSLDHVNFALFKPVIAAPADLRGASFNGAAISDSNFGDVDLRGASFYRATLSGVNFRSADLRGATFQEANVDENTNFDVTCLDGVSFVNTFFNIISPNTSSTTTFDEALGQDVDFSGAVNMSSVRLPVELKAHGLVLAGTERPMLSRVPSVSKDECQ
jgi:uncharacterized protein YjbI with pentapeptide repeats